MQLLFVITVLFIVIYASRFAKGLISTVSLSSPCKGFFLTHHIDYGKFPSFLTIFTLCDNNLANSDSVNTKWIRNIESIM